MPTMKARLDREAAHHVLGHRRRRGLTRDAGGKAGHHHIVLAFDLVLLHGRGEETGIAAKELLVDGEGADILANYDSHARSFESVP